MTLEELNGRMKREVVSSSILFTPQTSDLDAAFEAITMPHWTQFITPNDIDCIYSTVTSRRLAGNFDKRKRVLDELMAARGFKFLAGGTNRATYKHLEFPTIVAKVPIDRVGLHDNQCEYLNQKKLWPFCAKMIQVTPYGAVGFAERLEPILNRKQFNAFAPMIYWTITQIIGEFVMEDIGTNYYKNWGIRKGFGACLLDYVYLFDLDGAKLICKQPLDNGQLCFGEIDYDPGFNQLYCKKCGRMYNASELQMVIKDNSVALFDNTTIGGKKPMLVTLKKGNQVLSSSLNSDSIVRPDFRSETRKSTRPDTPKVTIKKGDVTLASSEMQHAVTGSVESEAPGTNVIKVDIPIPSLDKTKEADPTANVKIKYPEVEAIERDKTDENVARSISQFYPVYVSPGSPVDVIPEDKVDVMIGNGPVYSKEKKVYISKEDIKEEVKEEEEEKVDKPEPDKPKADEFPPNQWSVQPSLSSKPRRRIISDNSGSSEVLQRKPNPYNR